MDTQWKAQWIWLPGERQSPNCYVYARKTFALEEPCEAAQLHICAYTDYQLYVNGMFVGRGPSPSNGKVLRYDSHDIAALLTQGRNVIAVQAHNYGVGVHWNPAGPGGLLLQAEVRTQGQTLCYVTDETWKVKLAHCYEARSPRMMFSCRFLETFRAPLYEMDWHSVDYDDSLWRGPEVIGCTPVFPYERLAPREIPLLRETRLEPVSAEKARFCVEGFHGVSFGQIEEGGSPALYYATTCFFCEAPRKVSLLVSCDDAFAAFLNGSKVLEQSYDEGFVRTCLLHGREEYEQVHNGNAPRKECAPVLLVEGWNRLTVVVDQGPQGWGFALGFHDGEVDDRTDLQLLSLPFAAQPQEGAWMLCGPFPSTGMKNSLEHIDDDTPPVGGETATHYPSFLGVTDYQMLMRAEARTGFQPVNPREDVLLSEGECLIVDLVKMQVGYLALEIDCAAQAVLDLSLGNVLSEKRKPCGMGELRSVDRLYLSPGSLRWNAANRRDGRYLHISCRLGQNICLKSIALMAVGYPVVSKDGFACSDEVLNDIYRASKHSTALIMQHDYEDCLRREEGLHNGRNVIHAFMASYYAFGDGRLLRKMFLDLLYTQDDRGWISGSGPSDDTCDEISKSMWAIEYLLRYYQFTGDVAFLRHVYEQVHCFMRYLSRLENKLILIDGKNEYNNIRGRSMWIDDHVVSPDRPDLNAMLFSYNALYYGTLGNMAVLSDALGEAQDARFYRAKAHCVKDSFNQVFWNAKKGMYVDWVRDREAADQIQDAFLILALYYGICEGDKEAWALSRLFDPKVGTLRDFESYRFTFGYYYFIMNVLFDHGREMMAYDLLRTYFGAWLKLGFTAFGEHFFLTEAAGRTTLGREINVHTDSTAAHVFFYSHVLGIRPLVPGFAKITISPFCGDMIWAKGSAYTPLGIVEVDWKVEEGVFHMDIVHPRGMECDVKTPEGFVAGTINKIIR